jgi:hypothetical protein
MHAKTLLGPLFIIGVPRSGTKLLRGLLNEHPSIRIPEIETEFLPYWIENWRSFGQLDEAENFKRFFQRCLELPFFMQLLERGIVVDREEWFRSCRTFTPAGMFEALVRQVVAVPEGEAAITWGDKSPSYLRHVPLLLEHFPGATIVHIVRDARDCSLSMHRAWGKNMLRAAQRWNDDVSRAREDGRRFPDSYREIRYEDLLSNPRSTMQDLCAFTGIGFDERMLGLSASTENKGDARGRKEVVSGNVGKYRSNMDPAAIAAIERITCTTLKSLGYPCEYSGPPVRLPDWKLRLLQLSDGMNLVRATMAERGLTGSLQFYFRYFRTSGNRFG